LITFYKTGFTHGIVQEDDFEDKMIRKLRRSAMMFIRRTSLVTEPNHQQKIFLFSTKEYEEKLKNIEEAVETELVRGVVKLSNFYNVKNSVFTQKFKGID
jgi:hypothetical protein